MNQYTLRDWDREVNEADEAFNEYMSKHMDTARKYQAEVDMIVEFENDDDARSEQLRYLREVKYKEHVSAVSELATRLENAKRMQKMMVREKPEEDPYWWIMIDDAHPMNPNYEKSKGQVYDMGSRKTVEQPIWRRNRGSSVGFSNNPLGKEA